MSIPQPIILDISEWQPPSSINYDTLAKQIKGVIVRVQFGSNYIDKHYKTHLTEFKKRGIPVAVYAWVRGTSIWDMEKEATDFYNRAKAYNPTMWWLDAEEQSMSDMRSGIEAYRKKMKSLGAKKVGLYIANHLYSKFNLDTTKFDAIWVPAYGTNNGQYSGYNPTSTNNYHLHQYTDKGRLSGYNGYLDLNRIAKGSLSDLFGTTKTTVPVKETPKQTTGGKIKMKTIKLTGDVYLRTKPDAKSKAIALLKKNDEVEFNNIFVSGGYIWGEQPRKDKYKKGYIALGEFKQYGKIS